MKSRRPTLPILCSTLTLGLAAAAHAATVTAPYTEDFDSYAVGNTPVTNFSETSTAAYTIVSNTGGHGYQASVGSTSGATSASAAVQTTGIAGANFEVSTDLMWTGNTGTVGSSNFGLGLLGDSSNFSSGSQYRVLYSTITSNGKIIIVRNGDTAHQVVSSGAIAPTVNKALHLTVDGFYTGGSLTLYVTLTDGTSTVTSSYTDASPLTGGWFGYRTAIDSTGGSETAVYDNFALTVPEPAALGLLGLAALPLIGRRR